MSTVVLDHITNTRPAKATSAAAELRHAVYDTLRTDRALAEVLGGPRVWDIVPDAVIFPYVTIGDSSWASGRATHEERLSWGLQPGHGQPQLTEHLLKACAWSRVGHQEAHLVTGAVVQALDGVAMQLANHFLLSFSFALADVKRENDGRTFCGTAHFRAVTEPIGRL